MDGLSDWDICCGRGKGKWNSPGNQRFKDVVQDHLQQYADAPSKAEKSRIVEAVVAAVKEGGGRFVKQDETTGKWYPINAVETRAKVAHAIRDQYATSYKKRQLPSSPKMKRHRRLDSSDTSDKGHDASRQREESPTAPDFSTSSLVQTHQSRGQTITNQIPGNQADMLAFGGGIQENRSALAQHVAGSQQQNLLSLPFQQPEQLLTHASLMNPLQLAHDEDRMQFRIERRPFHPSQHLAELWTLPQRGMHISSFGDGPSIQQYNSGDLRVANASDGGEEKLGLDFSASSREAFLRRGSLRSLETSPLVGPRPTFPSGANIMNDGSMDNVGQIYQGVSSSTIGGHQLFRQAAPSADQVATSIAWSSTMFHHHDTTNMNRMVLPQSNTLDIVSGMRQLESHELSELVRGPLPAQGFHPTTATEHTSPSLDDFEPHALFPPYQGD